MLGSIDPEVMESRRSWKAGNRGKAASRPWLEPSGLPPGAGTIYLNSYI
jgi:hypothetical protein